MIRWREFVEKGTGGLRGPVLTLLTGSAVASGIGYAAKLVLLRLYDPAAFGLYEFVIAVVGVLLPVASLRYEDAVVLPERDEEARDVLGLAFLLSLGAVLLTLILIPLSDSIAGWAGEPGLERWIWTIPVVLLVVRLSRLGELWMTRVERFRRIAGANVSQAATMTATRIAVGLGSAGAGGLITGFGVGHGVAAVVNGSATLSDLRHVRGRLSGAGMRRVAGRYRRFAQFSAPATLVAALATRVPFLLLLFYFDREVLGLFGQAFNVLYVPIALLAAAIGQVFFVRAAGAVRENRLPGLAASVHDRLVLLAFLPVVAVAVAGPDVFQVLFGAPWRQAGVYAGWIAAWILFTGIASPLTRLFDVLERQRADLVVNLCMLAAIVAAVTTAGSSGSVRTTMLALGISGAVVRAGQILVSLRLAGVEWPDIRRPYLRHGSFALAAGVALALVRIAGTPAATTVSFFIVLLVFGVVVAKREGLLPWALE